jgi:hypothetical protein
VLSRSNSLGTEIQGYGEVLPSSAIDRSRPDLGVLSVQDLEGVLVACAADDSTHLEVELVCLLACQTCMRPLGF